MSEVFCDDLRLTVPEADWAAVESDVRAVLETLGASVEFKSLDRSGWRMENGTARSQKCGRVWSFSASGQLLAGLRAKKLFDQFLASFAAAPHRVTGIHCTTDRRQETPPVLSRILAAVNSPGGLRVSRKAVSPGAVQRHIGQDKLGRDTGTMYLGKKTAEVRAVVYDKRHQILSAGGPDLGHDLTRYELRLRSGVGASLRDAWDPAPLFWHYMAPDILERPPGVPDWVACGEPLNLPKRDLPSPAERLRSRVYASDDLASLVSLAGSFEGGPALLLGLIRSRLPSAATVPA